MKEYNMAKLVRHFILQALFIFLFISAFVVSTWYRGEFIYGGAEVGLFTYNPERWLEISRYVWWGASAPGQLIPQFIVGVPIYFFFSVLRFIGLSSQYIQQLFFTSVLFLMGFGAFLLSFEIMGESKRKYAYFTGLFYMFNVYTLVQVWHRFVYSTIILAAVLPFLVLFWRKWVNEGKIIHLIIFLLINFLSVYIYGNLSAIIAVWLTLLLVSLGETIFPWQDKVEVKKKACRFLVGFVFWLLTNIWWIFPTFSIAPALLSVQHSSEDNLGTLLVIGRQTMMPYLLQLVNPYYLYQNSELGLIYSSFIFRVIPWIMSGLIFLGLIVSLKVKNYARYSVIFVISILLAKGVAAPFSYPYIFGFEHFFFLGVLRNPFEKLGIMMPLFGSILFAIGIKAFFDWGVKHLGAIVSKSFIILIIIALLGFAWPMIGGKIFGTKEQPVQVKIPDSYIKADEWLKMQAEPEGVILHLPFAGKDVVTFNWGEGYHGVDQNSIIFTALPSLSRAVGIKRIDDTLNSLTEIFSPAFSQDKNQIQRILQDLNVKFIVLHKDTNWKDKDTYGEKADLLNPDALEKVLDNLEFLKKEKQIGELIIYRLVNDKYKPVLSVVDNFQIVYPGKSNIMQILSETANYGEIITPVLEDIDSNILAKSRQVLIFPDKEIEFSGDSDSAIIAKAQDSIDQLVEIKNYFLSLGDLHSEIVAHDLINSTQKLPQLSTVAQMEDYKESVINFFNKYNENLNIHLSFGSQIASIFRVHLAVLKQVGDSEISKIIENHLEKLELLPQYKIPGQAFKFVVPFDGNYDILSTGQDCCFTLNGADIVSQSGILFKKGIYEISSNSVEKHLKEDILLKLAGQGGESSAGQIVSINKKSAVSYYGKIHLEKASFVSFAQSYHPGWTLFLLDNGRNYKIDAHFLGNLYNNIWWVDKIGDYNFKINFLPQRDVDKGIIVASAATIFLLLVGFYVILKKALKK